MWFAHVKYITSRLLECASVLSVNVRVTSALALWMPNDGAINESPYKLFNV